MEADSENTEDEVILIRVYPPIGEPLVQKFNKSIIKIGRRSDNDLVLDDVYVSRIHAEIRETDSGLLLKDLNSRFGCHVNGIRIYQKGINRGDEIQLGNTIIRIIDELAEDKIKPIRLVQATQFGVEELKRQIDCLADEVSDQEVKKKLALIGTSFSNFEKCFGEVEQDRELARILIDVGRATNLIIDLRVLLNLMLDFALRILQGDKALIIVGNEVRAARGILIEEVEASALYRLGLECLKEKKSVAKENSLASPIFNKDSSIIGTICVEAIKTLETKDLTVLEGFASQAGLAIESVMLHDTIRREERIRDRLYRFFSPAVADAIIKEEHGLVGKQVEATVLFADIRGFTPMAESLQPDYTVDLLNHFLSVMTEEVFKEDGTLDKYIGDCVMAIFGAPISHPDDPMRAIRSAIGMNRRVKEVNETWHKKGFEGELKIGIGINTGKVLAGNIGGEQRMDYTVISDAVNLASRLEGVAKADQIIISNFTYDKVKDFIIAEKLDPVKVKGKKYPIQIYDVKDIK